VKLFVSAFAKQEVDLIIDAFLYFVGVKE